jgi:serine protease Do
VTPLTTQLAAQLGAPNTRGALVSEMTQRSDAWTAGLRPGDIILALNGKAVDDASQFMRMVADSKVGTNAKLEILRESRKLEVNVPITRQRATRRAR